MDRMDRGQGLTAQTGVSLTVTKNRDNAREIRKKNLCSEKTSAYSQHLLPPADGLGLVLLDANTLCERGMYR